MPSKIEHALALARMGLRVFPLKPGGKFPAIKEWPDLATTDEGQIKKWWEAGPDRNIGICTTGMLVLDVDPKDGHEVEAAQSLKWILQHQPPTTLINLTPTSGTHLIFKVPEGLPPDQVRNQTNWINRVDVRGWHGFIVGPGSTVPAGEYRLVNPGVPIVECPSNLLESVLTLKAKTSEVSDFGEVSDDYGKPPDVICAGERDDTIFRFASSWRQRGITWDQAIILLKDLHGRIEQTPGDEFTWDDALAKLKHVWDSYRPGEENDPAVQVTPPADAPQACSRQKATLQEAIDNFIYIEAGKRVADLRRHPTTAVMTLDEFKNTMKPDRIAGAELVTLWLRSPARQTVRDVGYFPADNLPVFSKVNGSYFNTYYGPSLEVPDECDLGVIEPFLEHIRFLYPDPRWYDLFLNWAAFTVQYPHVRIPWCFLTVSMKEGVGKGLLFALMSKVLGEHNCSLVQPDELSEAGGTYNGYLSGKTLVWWDEIKARSVDYERLRLLITSPQLMINHKYGAKQMEDIYANTGAFSNHLDAIRVSASDRRFFVHCVYSDPRSAAYYDRLWRMLDSDMPGHWLRFLKDRDVSRFSWSSSPPATAAKIIMQQSGTSPIDSILLDAIEEGLGPFACDIVDLNIAREYLEKVGQHYGLDTTRLPAQRVSNVINAVCPPLPCEKYRIPTPKGSVLPKRVRCKCIRKYDHWSQQPPAAIAAEYARARLISATGMDPGKALIEVEKIIEEVGS